ncbi:hypothetical protein DL766_010456 [Monosporascus sp. MC13-8B]|uniref:FAD-binding domain-containing protein n=1 Tax=Monosporascus cannonballus TaxID=155416 RepID=A0ABY0H1N8_9PEZI|nr:hypothetical protein DL762_008107 [Monosporascus cannonballus]RYO81957.1 hypothetical protein DL763_008408 [Monosporascus cannonballus]RYP01810.1 hypothetical protein DL766_010456 [Monosporascus sp. MC13-8B]
MPLKILIIGVGIGGSLMAFILQRCNPDHHITVIERSPTLRASGAQIDIRAQGIPLLRKLGLLDAVKARTVSEGGVEFVDKNDKRKAVFGVNDSGKGAQSFTSEYEIMRGDLVEVLYQASLEQNAKAGGKGGVKYEFGRMVTEMTQDETGVDVTFADGGKARYDLVIGADGQSSRTRRQVFGKETSDAAFKSLGVSCAFYSIPRDPTSKSDLAKWYNAPEGRLIMTRPSKPTITGVYLVTTKETDGLKDSLKQPAEKQKELWAKLYADAGWQADHLLDEMMRCDDFYAFMVGQVKLKHISKGRVALLGDAGYVPSPITGMGTTSAIVGAYVLAGELTRHKDDVQAALKAYDEAMRPFVAEAQKLPLGVRDLMFPKTQFGVSVLHLVVGVVSWTRVDKFINSFLPENKGGWTPPEYPELKLDS